MQTLDIQRQSTKPVRWISSGTRPALSLCMTDAIKRADAAYALFALDMLTIESREAKSLESYNATLYVGNANTTAETIRPTKK